MPGGQKTKTSLQYCNKFNKDLKKIPIDEMYCFHIAEILQAKMKNHIKVLDAKLEKIFAENTIK